MNLTATIMVEPEVSSSSNGFKHNSKPELFAPLCFHNDQMIIMPIINNMRSEWGCSCGFYRQKTVKRQVATTMQEKSW